MVPSIVKVVLLGLMLKLGSCQSKDGYTDENRSYEFGFTIEGEQHRYEKKDEKGIIMGEYGFITADGVYHVTVYATDENGNFRILKTRNIRIGLKKVQPVTTTTSKPTLKTLSGFSGCSGCLIPTTTKAPLPYAVQSQKGNTRNGAGENPSIDIRLKNPQIGRSSTPNIGQGNTYKGDNNKGSIPGTNEQSGNQQNNGFRGTQPSISYNQNSFQPTNTNINQANNNQNYNPKSIKESSGSYRNRNQPNTQNNKISNRNNLNPLYPKSNKNTNKFENNTTGERKLSDTEKRIMDFMARLYKFNYTLTFHGHEEEGDTLGNKRGSYFNNGRDGYQRKVVYLANEFGYQPTITLVKLDDASTPNEASEKDLTELKGNEFIWFYDKVNSTKRNQ